MSTLDNLTAAWKKSLGKHTVSVTAAGTLTLRVELVCAMQRSV